jgi:riboflavin synthase
MFTGIITDVGRLQAVIDSGRARRFEVETAFDIGTVEIGASIAHSGCCLTVVETGPGWFAVEVSGETLSKTNLADWRQGTRINLERAVRVGDELGGHLVLGHVDGVGQVISVDQEGGSRRLRIRAPLPLHRFIAQKGSVSVDGVSLTVNEVDHDVFGVNVIPHTLEVTTLGELSPDAHVNLEIDLLARYAARWNETL